MGVKPGYKQSEVGVIPEDWDAVPLDSISRVTSGKRLPAGYFVTDTETPHPYIRVSDMWAGKVVKEEIKYVPVEAFPSISQYRIFKEDLFISVAGTLGLVGKIPSELDGANLTENADRITDIRCCQDFLLYVLLSPITQRVIESIQTVGAQPKLALTRIRKFTIPLPPTLKEQSAIATALSDADALIHSLERLIAKKRNIKQGAMQELLTGKRKLPGFSGGWEVLPLSKLCRKIVDGTHFTPHYVENGIPFYSVENVTSDDFINVKNISEQEHNQLIQRCKPEKGDILLTRIGSIGDAKLIDWDIKASIYVSLALLKVNELIDARYLYCYSKTRRFVKDMEDRSLLNASPKKINMCEIGYVPICVPEFPEQIAIANILMDMDSEIAALESKLSKARQIKQGMMQELLTGRIRLT